MNPSSFTIRRAIALPALTIVGLIGLALTVSPVASQASSKVVKSGPPIVNTGPVRVTATSITLTGTVDPHGLSTHFFFEYGPTLKYGSKTEELPVHEPTTPEKVSVEQPVKGLLPGDHYRLVASNSDGTKPGRDREYIVKVKQGKTVFELPSSFQPTPVGGTFVLSGTLSGPGNSGAGRQVALQSSPYPYSATFTDVAGIPPITTGISGGFSFRIAHLTASTRFRVATTTVPLVVSETLTQLAEVRVTLKAQTSHHVKGLVRLYGTVSPAAVGAHVFLQLEQTPKPKQQKAEKPEKTPRFEEQERPPTFSTKFSTVAKRATRSVSRFSVVVTVKNTGNYRAFVQMPPGPIASGQSETIVLHAAPKKKHKK